MLNPNYSKGQKLEDAIFLIKKFEVKQAKNGSFFADITFSDNQGEITAKMWDVSAEFAASYDVGKFAKVSAVVQTYNESLQLIVNKIALVIPSQEELMNLIECAPYPSDKMYNKIVQVISEGKNEDIKKITLYLLEQNKEKLLYYPAAKSFHHAVKGGLLYHTYSMLRSAKALLEIYDFMDNELVYAGVTLHDICKLKEIMSDENGIADNYTTEGKLLGHITMMVCEIQSAAEKLKIDPEVALLLKHMVLSHHFYPEFGSPVMPMFPEAELLHYLDVLDSRMDQFKKTMNATPEKEFSDKVWILDKRSVYNHGLQNRVYEEETENNKEENEENKENEK